jgi:LPXTG-site transpeptidase (sortase) family protein
MSYTPLRIHHSSHHANHPHKKNIITAEYIQVLVLRTVGNFLVFSSLFFIAKTLYQPVQEEIKYFVNQTVAKEYIVASEEKEAEKIERDYSAAAPKGKLAEILNIKQVEALTPIDTNYSIVIPKIGANAKVIPNVNAAAENEYLEALKGGVAHTLGTAFPGEGGHVFLFAHSTDYIWNVGTYNAVFYLLYKLEKGDQINIFYQGRRYVYEVIDSKVVDPSEVEYITRKTDEEFLTLQTCWPLGTTLKRLLVFAKRVVK